MAQMAISMSHSSSIFETKQLDKFYSAHRQEVVGNYEMHLNATA